MMRYETSSIWSLKYRPDQLEDISGRSVFIDRFKEMSKKDDLPHMMFAGPKGYGKMLTAILTAKYILGDSFETNCKIVYASDPLTKEERDVVKDQSYVSTSKVGSGAGHSFTWPAFVFSRIKPFVEIKPIGSKAFKILIIRDFHKLQDDQQGFRRLMEKYSNNCRMILLTDEISSIIDPILSRCMLFLFNKIDFESYDKVISMISTKEGLDLKGNISKILYYSTEGRIGESINILQKASLRGKEITHDTIYDSISSEMKLDVNVLIRSLIQADIILAKEKKSKLMKDGFTSKEILQEISNQIYSLPIEENRKAGLIDLIGNLDYESLDGNDEEIQMENILYQIIKLSEISKQIKI
jgi:replication factor C small subunit